MSYFLPGNRFVYCLETTASTEQLAEALEA
jgi:hypothetical protein